MEGGEIDFERGWDEGGNLFPWDTRWYSGLFHVTGTPSQIRPFGRDLCVLEKGLGPAAWNHYYSRFLEGGRYISDISLLFKISREWLLYYLILNNKFLSHLKLLFGKIILEILHWATACSWERVTQARGALSVLTSTALRGRCLWPDWELSHHGKLCIDSHDWRVLPVSGDGHSSHEHRSRERFSKAWCSWGFHCIHVWPASFVFLIRSFIT